MKLRGLITAAFLTALLYVQQVVLSGLPNIHLTALLVMLYTLLLPREVLLMVAAFVLLEGLTYGFGIWWFSYLYLWPLLVLVTWLCRKNTAVLAWALLAGVFGLCYGALCGIPYLLAGGPAMFFSYWVAGIPFDVMHCAGNFVVTLVLWKPAYHVLQKLCLRHQIQ